MKSYFIFLFTKTRRFRTIIRPYYRGAAGIVLAYDVTDEKTFRNIEDWTKNIAENTQSCQIIPKVLIANKTDLPYKSHHVQVRVILTHNIFQNRLDSNFNQNIVHLQIYNE